MASYNVQQNPYYTPPVAKNWIADRIIAAMQSFSAPRGPEALPTGVSGPPEAGALPRKPAGFFSALGGNDNNRINQAALLRQADVDAGRVPFEAEVGAQEKLQGNEFGFKKQQDDAFLAQRRAEDEARRTNALERVRESNTTARQINDDRINASIQEQALKRAYDMTQDSRRLRNAITLRQTPAAMSEADVMRMNRPMPVGGNALFDPKTRSIIQLPNQGRPQQTIQLPQSGGFSESELRFLNTGVEEPMEDASGATEEQMTDIEELLNPTGIPRGISY